MKAITLVLLVVALAAPAAAQTGEIQIAAPTACEVDGEAGVVAIDGSCMTPSAYADAFSNESIEAAGYEAHPEPDPLKRSVAYDAKKEPDFTFKVWLSRIV
jgi:hypothetical protein